MTTVGIGCKFRGRLPAESTTEDVCKGGCNARKVAGIEQRQCAAAEDWLGYDRYS